MPAALSATSKTAAKKEEDSNDELPAKIIEAEAESLRFRIINSLEPSDAVLQLEALGAEKSQEAPEPNN